MEYKWGLPEVGCELLHPSSEHVKVALDITPNRTFLIIPEFFVPSFVIFLRIIQIDVVFIRIESRLDLLDVYFVLPAMLDQNGLEQIMV